MKNSLKMPFGYAHAITLHQKQKHLQIKQLVKFREQQITYLPFQKAVAMNRIMSYCCPVINQTRSNDMTTKTYTKRENAKRAALAAGVPAGQIEITVHENAEGVRFGWKKAAEPMIATSKPKKAKKAQQAPTGGEQGEASTLVPAKLRSRPVAACSAPQREERNGVKRRRAGGLCAQVWDWLDKHPTATVKEAKAVAPEHGWNVNNVTCEFYAWRKFNGRAAA
jgi:hypothetical protein